MIAYRNAAKPQARRALLSWSEAPRLNWADVAAMVWAERVAVIFTGAVVCLIGFALASLAPRTYTARAELLVRLGQEYVYQPNTGAAGAGATPDMQQVINSEMRMLASGAVARRAIRQVGFAALYPDLASGQGAADPRRMAAAERAFASALTLETAPQTPAIALSFKHKNPEVAARALNALMDQYLAYRREVLMGGESEALARQSQSLDARSRAANATLSAFLAENNIGDFESELRGLAQRAADAETQAFDAQARRREAEARASALRSRVASEPAEIELYSESDARKQLVDLQLQREQLLSRYQDNAPPVREIDRRIQQLETFLQTGDTSGLTRRGQNPVRQDLAGQLYAMEAEARAQAGRELALSQQRDEVRARLRRMQALETSYRQLLRERTILETNATSFASRAEEARAFSQLLGRSTDNISTVERASPPAQGKSLKLPIALATLFLAAIVALTVGLGRALLRRSFATPSSAARTLGLPVLAVAPDTTRTPLLGFELPKLRMPSMPKRAPKPKQPRAQKEPKAPKVKAPKKEKAAKEAKAQTVALSPANDTAPVAATQDKPFKVVKGGAQ